MRTCKECGRSEEEVDFYTHRRVCKLCIVERQRDRRKAETEQGTEVSKLMGAWPRASA